MNICIEKLITIVTREVIAELQRRGIAVDGIGETGAASRHAAGAAVRAAAGPASREAVAAVSVVPPRRAAIDLSMFKTPVLAEHHLLSLDPSVTEIVIPRRTVITPGARDVIKKRSLVVSSDVGRNDISPC